MDERERDRLSRKLTTALGLVETGVAMKRAQLRRADPNATDAEIDRRLRAWLLLRPGAQYGDVAGDEVRVRTG